MALNQYGRLVLVVLLACMVSAQKSCFTPNGSYGRCVFYKHCTYVMNVLEKYGQQIPQVFRDYVFKSRCNTDGNEVYLCCDVSHLDLEAKSALTTTTTSTTVRTPTVRVSEDYENDLNPTGLAVLNEQTCGESGIPKVAYGTTAKLFEYPWMALLQYDSDTQPFQCGGTLITNRYVLTAGHCVINTDNRLIGVRLGDLDISKEKDCEIRGKFEICSEPAEDFRIEKIIRHPDYDSANVRNDVALIKLDRNVYFKRHIKPICLPISKESAQIPEEKKLFIAGWGLTEKNVSSTILMKGTLSYVDPTKCKAIYKRRTLTNNHICAGGEEKVDSCNGDSGGPLFYISPYKDSAKYVQFGIISFGGQLCGYDVTYPGIYSNVVDLMPWITSNID